MYFLILFFNMLTSQFSDDSLDLKNFRWRHRIVCISSENKERIMPLLNEFRINKKGLEERKLIVFLRVNGEFYEGLNMQSVGSIINFPESNAKYKVHLIGLDGGIKNVWDEQVSLQTIFNTIDAMPMRMSERSNH